MYNLSGSSGDDFVDVVFASPSFEVGIDLPNVTESIMTRAVRNLASYRQKAGRVGRESMSDGMNVTVTTNSSNDIHFYRQPRKLIEPDLFLGARSIKRKKFGCGKVHRLYVSGII